MEKKKLDRSDGLGHFFPLQFLIDLRICRVCVETTTNQIWLKYAMFSPRLVIFYLCIYYYWEKGERSCVGRIEKKNCFVGYILVLSCFRIYVFNAFSHQLDRMNVFVSVSDPERWNRGWGSTFPKCGSQDPDPKRWFLYFVSSSAH